MAMSRACADCMVCCFIGGVPALEKPAHADCPHADHGCLLHGSSDRPEVCTSFECAWLRGIGLPEDRPDLNGIMCSINKLNGGKWIFVIELKPDSALTTGRSMVERLVTLATVPAILVNYGSAPPDDRGDRVVIKAELKSRSAALMGEFMGHLDEAQTMGVYQLRMS